MKILKLFFAIAFSIFLVGCSSLKPINEPTYRNSGYTTVQIEKAILAAEKANRGWVLKKEKNGLITGRLFKGRYNVEVEIPYSAAGYTIKYKHANLKSDGERVHKTYNRWVATLDNDIQKALFLL